MIVLIALMLGIGAIFYALEAFNIAKNNYQATLKLYLKQNLLQANISLMPFVIKKASEVYYENPYIPFYKAHFKVEDFKFKIIIKDDTNFNINLIKQKPYLEFFERLSNEFCMPTDFTKYIYYWIGGDVNVENRDENYIPTFSPMKSRQEVFYAYTNHYNILYQNNCHNKRHQKGIIYYLDTKNQSININTAPIEILKALDPNITDFVAKEIVDYRRQKPIKHIQDLMNIRGISIDDIYTIQKIATTKSNIMIIYIDSSIKYGGAFENLHTKIYYSPLQNNIIGIYQN